MRNRFIFPSEARLSRFKVANYYKKNVGQSQINPEISSITIILSSGSMCEAGHT
jgi:hypothetical protein